MLAVCREWWSWAERVAVTKDSREKATSKQYIILFMQVPVKATLLYM